MGTCWGAKEQDSTGANLYPDVVIFEFAIERKKGESGAGGWKVDASHSRTWITRFGEVGIGRRRVSATFTRASASIAAAASFCFP